MEEKYNSTTFCLRCGVLETAAASRQSTVLKQNVLSFQQRIHSIWINHLNLFLHLRYVFHSAGILPDPSYQGRVEYFGQPGTNNCSLKISDLRQSDSGTYVFYLITDHPSEKMPAQSGIQLLVAGRGSFIDRTLNLSLWSFLFFFPFSTESLVSLKTMDKKTQTYLHQLEISNWIFWRDHMTNQTSFYFLYICQFSASEVEALIIWAIKKKSGFETDVCICWIIKISGTISSLVLIGIKLTGNYAETDSGVCCWSFKRNFDWNWIKIELKKILHYPRFLVLPISVSPAR